MTTYVRELCRVNNTLSRTFPKIASRMALTDGLLFGNETPSSLAITERSEADFASTILFRVLTRAGGNQSHYPIKFGERLFGTDGGARQKRTLVARCRF